MKKQAEALIPTEWGNFNLMAYADTNEEQMPHLAIVHEDFDPSHPTLLRIHSECLTGDILGSKRCDCGDQLAMALKLASEQGGAVIYLRQEGRGIGLINKLKAYQLQDQGINTADANTHLGFEVDARQYDIAIDIMKDLEIRSIRLLTNNPLMIKALEDSQITILERIPIIIKPKEENKFYLKTKQQVMGHLFNL